MATTLIASSITDATALGDPPQDKVINTGHHYAVSYFNNSSAKIHVALALTADKSFAAGYKHDVARIGTGLDSTCAFGNRFEMVHDTSDGFGEYWFMCCDSGAPGKAVNVREMAGDGDDLTTWTMPPDYDGYPNADYVQYMLDTIKHPSGLTTALSPTTGNNVLRVVHHMAYDQLDTGYNHKLVVNRTYSNYMKLESGSWTTVETLTGSSSAACYYPDWSISGIEYGPHLFYSKRLGAATATTVHVRKMNADGTYSAADNILNGTGDEAIYQKYNFRVMPALTGGKFMVLYRADGSKYLRAKFGSYGNWSASMLVTSDIGGLAYDFGFTGCCNQGNPDQIFHIFWINAAGNAIYTRTYNAKTGSWSSPVALETGLAFNTAQRLSAPQTFKGIGGGIPVVFHNSSNELRMIEVTTGSQPGYMMGLGTSAKFVGDAGMWLPASPPLTFDDKVIVQTRAHDRLARGNIWNQSTQSWQYSEPQIIGKRFIDDHNSIILWKDSVNNVYCADGGRGQSIIVAKSPYAFTHASFSLDTRAWTNLSFDPTKGLGRGYKCAHAPNDVLHLFYFTNNDQICLQAYNTTGPSWSSEIVLVHNTRVDPTQAHGSHWGNYTRGGPVMGHEVDPNHTMFLCHTVRDELWQYNNNQWTPTIGCMWVKPTKASPGTVNCYGAAGNKLTIPVSSSEAGQDNICRNPNWFSTQNYYQRTGSASPSSPSLGAECWSGNHWWACVRSGTVATAGRYLSTSYSTGNCTIVNEWRADCSTFHGNLNTGVCFSRPSLSGDFKLRRTIYVTNVSGTGEVFNFMVVSNTTDATQNAHLSSGKHLIAVGLTGGSGALRFKVKEIDNGVLVSSATSSTTLPLNGWVRIEIERVGSTLYCRYYTAAWASVTETLTLSLANVRTYSYEYAIQSTGNGDTGTSVASRSYIGDAGTGHVRYFWDPPMGVWGTDQTSFRHLFVACESWGLSTPQITGITKANPAVITAPGHGFTAGNNGTTYYVEGVFGMTEINGQGGSFTYVDEDSFTLAINSTAFSTYECGGGIVPNNTEAVWREGGWALQTNWYGYDVYYDLVETIGDSTHTSPVVTSNANSYFAADEWNAYNGCIWVWEADRWMPRSNPLRDDSNNVLVVKGLLCEGVSVYIFGLKPTGLGTYQLVYRVSNDRCVSWGEQKTLPGVVNGYAGQPILSRLAGGICNVQWAEGYGDKWESYYIATAVIEASFAAEPDGVGGMADAELSVIQPMGTVSDGGSGAVVTNSYGLGTIIPFPLSSCGGVATVTGSMPIFMYPQTIAATSNVNTCVLGIIAETPFPMTTIAAVGGTNTPLLRLYKPFDYATIAATSSVSGGFSTQSEYFQFSATVPAVGGVNNSKITIFDVYLSFAATIIATSSCYGQLEGGEAQVSQSVASRSQVSLDTRRNPLAIDRKVIQLTVN